MNVQSKRTKQIKLLQENLSSIRKIAGWTTEQLGEKIGVTKQTISNLENEKSPMNFTQYIAIRSVLDCEIESNKGNEVLPKVIDILLNKGDVLSEEDYDKVKSTVEITAASAAGGISGASLASTFGAITAASLVGILPVAVPVVGAIVAGSLPWLKELLKKSK